MRQREGSYKLPAEPDTSHALGIGVYFGGVVLLTFIVGAALLWAADRQQAEFEAERWERLQLEVPE